MRANREAVSDHFPSYRFPDKSGSSLAHLVYARSHFEESTVFQKNRDF